MRLHPKLRIISSVFIALIFVSACSDSNKQPQDTKKQSATSKVVIPKMEILVTTQWLSEHLNDPDLVVLDSTLFVNMDEKGNMTMESGRARYQEGHIPTAGFADLKGDLSGGDGSLNFVMPTPEQFRVAIGSLGVGNDSRVVIYSAENHDWAARLWWMFKWAGLDQVAILDGGLAAWKADGRQLSTGASNRPAKEFTLALQPKLIADRDEVFNAITNEQVRIVDALPPAHYEGKFALYSRPGHIPSATNMSTSDLINESGHFKSFDELDMMYDSDHSKRVITYCGVGGAASTAAYTLYRLGYTDVAVYMGSLQEWVVNPENPMTTDIP